MGLTQCMLYRRNSLGWKQLQNDIFCNWGHDHTTCQTTGFLHILVSGFGNDTHCWLHGGIKIYITQSVLEYSCKNSIVSGAMATPQT